MPGFYDALKGESDDGYGIPSDAYIKYQMDNRDKDEHTNEDEMATYIDALNGDHTDGSEQFRDWRSPRQQLQDEYIARIVDGMDIKDLVQYAYDKLSEELDEYSDEGLTQQVKDTYPDLLENQ